MLRTRLALALLALTGWALVAILAARVVALRVAEQRLLQTVIDERHLVEVLGDEWAQCVLAQPIRFPGDTALRLD